MRVDDFSFELPDELIALRPARPRTQARLLVVRGPDGDLEDRSINDLPGLLKSGDILVQNTTRVINAALTSKRRRLTELGDQVTIEINLNRQLSSSSWSAFARPAKRLAVGDTVDFGPDFQGRVITKSDGGQIDLQFNLVGQALEAAIQAAGQTPLPPYIRSRRAVDASDAEDYQTCFSTSGRSVAAPTAGLHFTPELLAQLSKRGVKTSTVSLDVNAGTFLPMKVDDITEHKMHAEYAVLAADQASIINEARSAEGRCIAIGTTALRTLESAAENDKVSAFAGDTSIFITPGHKFQVTDALLTNFHLPRSTLFVLVSAFMGLEVMKRAYAHAVSSRYRFYSYGDACLLLPNG